MTETTTNISYFSITTGGALLALKLRDRFGGTARLPACQSMGCRHCDPYDSLTEALPERFSAGDTLICIMAAGVAFRILAPHLASKQQDPAVIVLDEEGRHIVPLLGGHAAGANRLAREIADFLGGEAVITTSSDVQGLTAPDEVARLLGLLVVDTVALRKITAKLVDGKPVCIESRDDPGIADYTWVEPEGDVSAFEGRLLISHLLDGQLGESKNMAASAATSEMPETAKLLSMDKPNPGAQLIRTAQSIPTARLIPRSVVAGIGCRRGAPAAEIIAAIASACERSRIDPRAIAVLASVDVKHDEAGLADAAAAIGAETVFFPANRLAALERPGSDFVAAAVGTPAVSEPAALLAAGEDALLISGKEAYGQVTVALALKLRDFETATSKPGGCVLVVGTGAGTAPLLTAEAAEALRAADVIMGYRTYVEQVRELFPGKEFITGSMGAEIDRCRSALELAAGGRKVAMVSSGDPGVYGMAGLLLELAGEVPVRVIPGVTAAQIAAARLGAPLMNDYLTLSLSDLLTPREEVLRRARLAAESDLVICIYNPSSKKRRPLFEEVCGIFSEARPAGTPVGWVRAAGGPDETSGISTLTLLAGEEIDMRTIVIIGNSRTRLFDGRMVTSRGYEKKNQGL